MLEQYPVAAPLQCLIKGYWLLDAGHFLPGQTQYLFPSGAVEIIIHFKTPLTRVSGNTRIIEPQSFVEGQQSGTLSVEQTAGVKALGVTLHPWAVYPLLGISSKELTNNRYPLSEAGHALKSLPAILNDCDSTQELIACCDRFFTTLLLRSARFYNASDLQLISIMQHGVESSLSVIKKAWPYSVRLLEQKFVDVIGMPAGDYFRKKKMAKMLSRIAASPQTTLTQLALEAGYYDQAHFIRHFRHYFLTNPRNFACRDEHLLKAFYA